MKYYDKLAQDKQWTILLRSLPEGSTKVTFPDENCVKIFRTMAYQPYGDTRQFSYSIKKTDIPTVVDIIKTKITN